jgi:glycosyltransferase involved in cell wall biosynthesis
MKISLVLLTFNEIDGLHHVFNSLPLDTVDEVFAVDGGSTDGTREFFQQHTVRIMDQTCPGRGEAFREAFRQSQCDAIIFFSPDGNEGPEDIPRFRSYLEQGCDMVIASRMMKGAYNEEDDQIFKFRKWANNAFNLLANIAFRRSGPYITDSINGYRAMTKTAFNRLQPDGSGYTIEYQMTIRALKHRMNIIEFPTHEYPRAGGESYAKSIPTGLRFIKIFLRELFSKRNESSAS